LTIPGQEDIWQMIVMTQLAPCLQKSHWVRAKCFIAISGLEKRGASGSFVTSWFQGIPSSLDATSFQSAKAKESQMRSRIWRNWWNTSRSTLNGLSLVTSQCSPDVIPMTRSWRRHELSFLIESNKSWQRKMLDFDPLVS
jgi:hypothetical protein